ncbi:ABC transporter substrate-binding protein [Pelagibius litoralis]|uniref:ABC transporter substrate-binding protein n=1 Tax=Pelagibius litoralis TaxID=374515 RepID=A0A967EX74_9PROT|nr:ABC transporter substrate-binding protein [Pelagibius litoralis]NIA68075.1 ABC transporter substrate-binding protein [Pelagibius litoralis]
MDWKTGAFGFRSVMAAGAFALAAVAGQPAAKAAEISIACGALGVEFQLCKEGAEAWAAESGHTVRLVNTPNSTTERLALYQQLLAAGADDIDVFQIDVIWPGMLANHFIDLKPHSGGAEAEHFQAIVDNNTVDGRLVAMPWFTDAGILYYRKDLLEQHGKAVPVTWQELTETAAAVQEAERSAGNDKLWGFVWQGKAYEGLTCDALEWIDSFGGGAIVDAKGKITINNPQAAKALDMAAGWVGTISPPGVLNYSEEEARGVFQSGNAVFMRNWPYAWAPANGEDSPVRDKVGVTALPKGGADGKHSGTLGGWQLAVSKYSAHSEAAANLVMYLTGAAEQKRRAITGAYNPTIASLYEDEEVLLANPFFGSLYSTFTNAVARPSKIAGAKYNRVSNEFWNATHAVLSGKMDGTTSLAQLERKLKRVSRNGKW